MNKHGYLVRQDQSLKGNGRHRENYPYYSHPITLDFFEIGKTRNRKMLGTVWSCVSTSLLQLSIQSNMDGNSASALKKEKKSQGQHSKCIARQKYPYSC